MSSSQNSSHKKTLIAEVTHHLNSWSQALGFAAVGITNIDLTKYTARYENWVHQQFHGAMHYMTQHGLKRLKPALLVPGTISIISVRMDYLPQDTNAITILQNPKKAYISRYALGRDYHRLMRKRLVKLVEKIASVIGPFGYRVFADSAPVLEKPIAEKAGLGWIGKHTNLINSKAGSWFFLGEIFTDLPLPIQNKTSTKSHCGSCTACIDVCPTQAIVAPYQLDARRCISYLTIELKGTIPKDLRPLMGNRIYGCDDCQLFCPWNKFAKYTSEEDFKPRHQLSDRDLLALFAWDEQTFLKKTEGSAIRRIGYHQWLRNIAIALGNAPYDDLILEALKAQLNSTNEMVNEHIQWAIQQQITKGKDK